MGKNDVAKKANTEVSTEVNLGFADQLDSDDCERGRIALGQPGSVYVKEDLARAGAWVNLADMTELGYKSEKALEVILVGFFKYWIQSDTNSQDFIKKVPGTNANEMPWKQNIDGRDVSNTFHFSYLVLLPSEIEEGIAVPYELPFRSTELASSRKMNAIIKKMAAKEVPVWGKVFELTSGLKSKGKFSWMGSTVAIGRDTTADEKETAHRAAMEFETVKAKAMNDQTDTFVAKPAAETTEAQY